MSNTMLKYVWDGYRGEGGSELLTLVYMADISRDDGRCWPSIRHIAQRVRLSRSQAQRIVHRLVDAGYVSVIGNESGGRPGATRQYRINIDALLANCVTVRAAEVSAVDCEEAKEFPPAPRVDGATSRTDTTRRKSTQHGSRACTETGRATATLYLNQSQRNTKDTAIEMTSGQPDGQQKLTPSTAASADSRFSEFWNAWPAHERKQDKKKCFALWQAKRLDSEADRILADIETKRRSAKWRGGFIELPLTYLRGERWNDGGYPSDSSDRVDQSNWWETLGGVRDMAQELGLAPYEQIDRSGNTVHWSSYVNQVRAVVRAKYGGD